MEPFEKDPNWKSLVARHFEKKSACWNKNPEQNRLFVQCQENYANHMLHSRGHIFLNEVYDMLGLSRTTMGAVSGWLMAGTDNNKFIDFDLHNERNAKFMLGEVNEIFLDFNVDGVIYDKI